MGGEPQIAYGIEAIHDSIVTDTDIFRKYSSNSKKISLYREKKKILDKYPELKEIISAKFVSSLDKARGKFVGKVDWLPPQLVMTDQRIREMCRNMFTYSDDYVKKTGLRFGPCPGLEKMSGCPMFSPGPKEIRPKLDKADIFIAMQSKDFIKRDQIPGWHSVIMIKLKREIEKLLGEGSVTDAFGAGPCQLCHPQPCLAGGKCRSPKLHLYSLESVGIPVGQLCKDIALVSGNDDWKITWIKYFNTPRQTSNKWKLTSGLAVKLKGKR